MRSNRLFLGDDLHRHIGGDVRHQTNGDDVFAGRLDGAERRANLRLLDLEAELVHRFSDVGVGDGAEQTAVDAALAGDRRQRREQPEPFRVQRGELRIRR